MVKKYISHLETRAQDETGAGKREAASGAAVVATMAAEEFENVVVAPLLRCSPRLVFLAVKSTVSSPFHSWLSRSAHRPLGSICILLRTKNILALLFILSFASLGVPLIVHYPLILAESGPTFTFRVFEIYIFFILSAPNSTCILQNFLIQKFWSFSVNCWNLIKCAVHVLIWLISSLQFKQDVCMCVLIFFPWEFPWKKKVFFSEVQLYQSYIHNTTGRKGEEDIWKVRFHYLFYFCFKRESSLQERANVVHSLKKRKEWLWIECENKMFHNMSFIDCSKCRVQDG